MRATLDIRRPSVSLTQPKTVSRSTTKQGNRDILRWVCKEDEQDLGKQSLQSGEASVKSGEMPKSQSRVPSLALLNFPSGRVLVGDVHTGKGGWIPLW